MSAWSFGITPGGDLEHVRFDGVEVLRGLQFVVRDDAWGTVPGERRVVETAGGAEVRASFAVGEGRIDAIVTLSVGGAELRYAVDATVSGTVLTNRVGLVALHPLSLAGEQVRVRHPDGSTSSSVFPELVAPHQPFLSVAGLVHGLAQAGSGDSDARVDIDFEGEVFETEDQRNWSDASFKTYGRPLALPFPYLLQDGERVRQAVTVRVTGSARPERAGEEHSDVVALAADWSASHERPVIGVQLGPDDTRVDGDRLAELVAALHVDHVRVDVVAEAAGLRDDGALDAAHGLPIELAVHLGAEPAGALEALAAALRGRRAPLRSVLLLDTEHPATRDGAVELVRAALGGLLDGVPVVVGTDDNLAELSRTAPDTEGADGIGFSLNPQVHDERDRAVIETAEAVPAMIATARTLAPAGTPVHIGALTLKPRRVIYRPGAIDRLVREAGSIDPRQHDAFAGAWLTATLAALIGAGVESVTTLELTGPRGVVLEPAQAAAGASALSPAGAVIAALAAATTVGVPLVDMAHDVALIPLSTATGRASLVANLAPVARQISVDGAPHPFDPYQSRLLPEGSPS